MVDALGVLDGLRQLNAIDVTLLAWLAYTALAGMRQGLVTSVLQLGGLVAALAIGATQYGRLLEPILAADVWPITGALAEVVAFVGAVAVARVVAAIVAGLLARAWKSTGGRLPVLGVADTILGAVPGLARGLIVGALAMMPLRGLTLVPSVSETVATSVVALRLLDILGGIVPAVRLISGV